MGYQLVAEGTFDDIEARIANMEFPKGTKIKVVMEVPAGLGYVFDVAGAEWLFQAPQGAAITDVYGADSRTGVVEMESDPVWLIPMIGTILSSWVGVVLVGITLAAIVVSIKLFADIVEEIPGVFSSAMPLAVAGLVGMGLWALVQVKKR